MPKKDQLQNWAVVSKIGQFSHGTVLKFMLLKDLILDWHIDLQIYFCFNFALKGGNPVT